MRQKYLSYPNIFIYRDKITPNSKEVRGVQEKHYIYTRIYGGAVQVIQCNYCEGCHTFQYFVVEIIKCNENRKCKKGLCLTRLSESTERIFWSVYRCSTPQPAVTKEMYFTGNLCYSVTLESILQKRIVLI